MALRDLPEADLGFLWRHFHESAVIPPGGAKAAFQKGKVVERGGGQGEVAFHQSRFLTALAGTFGTLRGLTIQGSLHPDGTHHQPLAG
jgi:hypothetical protein